MNMERIVDMENRAWMKIDRRFGEHWRAISAYRCRICGCVTNHFLYMKYLGPILLCPGKAAMGDLHHQLEKKLYQLGEGHPRSYIQEQVKEIKELRTHFTDINPDVDMIGIGWEKEKIKQYLD
jgi:hypothetical protein